MEFSALVTSLLGLKLPSSYPEIILFSATPLIFDIITLSNSSKSVKKNLRYLEKGEVDKLNLSNYDNKKLKNGIIYELPSGIIFNNTLLNNILPKIPIKMHLIGNVLAKLTTNVDSYGINNALIKVNINIEAEVKILMPFVSSNTKLNVDVPILMKIMEGNVPSYYFGGYLDTIVNE